MQSLLILREPNKKSINSILATSILGIILGLVMLFYPGGTMNLMATGFLILKIILSLFIGYFFISDAVHGFRSGQMVRSVAMLVLGAALIGFLWFIDVRLLYFVVAFFLVVLGISEIIGAFVVPVGKFFFALLGILDLIIAVIIVRHPVVLALLIAWYVLFWGISRLFLALELRKALAQTS